MSSSHEISTELTGFVRYNKVIQDILKDVVREEDDHDALQRVHALSDTLGDSWDLCRLRIPSVGRWLHI